MKLDAVFQIRLSKEEKAKVFRLAALRTLDTGERISAGEVLRDLALSALENAESTDNADSTSPSGNDELIKFKPAPEVSQAIKRARLNSGESTDKVINALLTEALQLEAGA